MSTYYKNRQRYTRGKSDSVREREEAEVLERIRNGTSTANIAVIVNGFVAKGIDESDIRPRENVLTYKAWHATGRQVDKGEHGVKVHTVVEKETMVGGKSKTEKFRRTATVFHISQTHELDGDKKDPLPQPPPAEPQPTPPPSGIRKGLAEAMRTRADRLQDRIDKGRRPMTQRHTPKRYAAYMSRVHEANNTASLQQALRVLADLHDSGSVPALIFHCRTNKEIASMVQRKCESNRSGYHPFVTTSHEFYDSSPAARVLQAFIDTGFSEKQKAIFVAEQEIRNSNIPGFFPTPMKIAERMVELADLQNGDEILEPSAGMGHIADVISDEMDVSCELQIMEINPMLCEYMKFRNHDPICDDFLNTEGECDKIIMNPPFENGQDIEHVRHAYSLLRPGGLLVSLISGGPFFREDKKSKFFRTWFRERNGTSTPLPDDSFNGVDAFKATGVAIILITMRKGVE